MNYEMRFRDSLFSAIEELKKKHDIECTNYYIHIKPDTSDKELSRINSLDLYYRDGFLNGAYERKPFKVEKVIKMLAAPWGLPLWMDMSLLSYENDELHIQLFMSIRFRKTSQLMNQETGHPPIRVV